MKLYNVDLALYVFAMYSYDTFIKQNTPAQIIGYKQNMADVNSLFKD